MQRIDFSHITDDIAKVIETEERLLNDLSVEVITLRKTNKIVPSSKYLVI